ncbi:MAG: electron transport complex subunit RsxC [Candidatus Latescibacteria bacterium 4484_107]|nr:MAG: electron transport complex subunit RsxC [Candidatus Latescibacteria bacterium 4484_107]
MRKKTFKRGVHPPYRKTATQHLPLVTMPPPERVVIPCSQHIGAPSEPIVSKGDEVKIGQPISQAKGFVSVPSHASISGKVAAIEPLPHPLGMKAEAIVIEGDGEKSLADGIGDRQDWGALTADQLKERIRDAGIAGLGGATFPTHVKLSPPEDQPIDTVLLNGAECEPYITADHRVMLEQSEEIIEGLKIILKVLNISRAYIGIEANKPDAIAKMEALVAKEPSIEVVPLQVKYPQGAEKQLIYAVTRRIVPAGALPMKVGCLVQNVGTAAAIYQAVARSTPLIERAVTVTGGGVREPKNLRVRIGTPFREVIAFCGGTTEGAAKLVMGGPMMGIAQATDEVPVIKGTSCILVLDREEAALDIEPKPCISCGRCVDQCPMRLIPSVMATLVEHERWDEAEDYGIMDCFECGSCTYTCPSKRHLTHLFKYGKSVIAQRKKQAQAA